MREVAAVKPRVVAATIGWRGVQGQGLAVVHRPVDYLESQRFVGTL